MTWVLTVMSVSADGFDPANPGNPNQPDNRRKHAVILQAEPAQAASFNFRSGRKFYEDEWIDVWAWQNNGYSFQYWEQDGQIVSDSYNYYFQMGTEDVNLTAHYVFNPGNPGNPGRNAWYPHTGEMLISDFYSGDLYSAIHATLGYREDFSQIKHLTIVGYLYDYDLGVVSYMENLVNLDLRRAYGFEVVPSFAFAGKTNLIQVVLPASVREVQSYAFEGCTSLNSIYSYAMSTPDIDVSAFSSIGHSVNCLYVPNNALGLYLNHPIWGNTDYINSIRSIEDLVSVNLHLPFSPETGVPQMYKNMTIELVNNTTEQSYRYLVTERLNYSFFVLNDYTYTAYIKTSDGEIISTIENIEVTKEDEQLDVTFGELQQLLTATVNVKDAAGEDITEEVTIQWYKIDGSYLSKGSTLKNQLAGTELKYWISLPKEIAMEHQLPADTVIYDWNSDVNICQLTALAKITLEGKVTDMLEEEDTPLAGAHVAVSQTLHGQYSKMFSTTADEGGNFQIEVYDTETSLLVSMNDYVSTEQKVEKNNDKQNVKLKPVKGAKLSLKFMHKNNKKHDDGDPEESEMLTGISNIDYVITNLTTGEHVKEYVVKNNSITILDEVDEEADYQIEATSRDDSFAPTTSMFKIHQQKSDVEFHILKYGSVYAEYLETDNAQVVSMLYNAQGQLVDKKTYQEKKVSFDDLHNGHYTLITMAYSRYFNSFGTLEQLHNSELREGYHYLLNDVVINKGFIEYFVFGDVPVLPDLAYTSPATTFVAAEPTITAGQFQTLKARLDFKEQFHNDVCDVMIQFTLPEGCEFVNQSVTVGNNGNAVTYSYDAESRLLNVWLNDWTDEVRFCVTPFITGTCSPSAVAYFNLGTAPMGTANFEVESITIKVPSITTRETFTASGIATPSSDVKVFDEDQLIGSTRSDKVGNWSTECMLINPVNESIHYIYAKVTTPEEQVLNTPTKELLYDHGVIEVEHVFMRYNGKVIDFNFIEPSNKAATYSFVPSNPLFTFEVLFRELEGVDNVNDLIADVAVEIVLAQTSATDSVPALYSKKMHRWAMSASYPNGSTGKLPINVIVHFTTKDGRHYCIISNCRNCKPSIDPQGFVYEAVTTNRISGVTATAFRADDMDENGNPVNPMMWDDAADYDNQENPLITDEEGKYQWDVPYGWWQVKFEKEGYETAYSEWLPVPPPQMDVNVAMVQLTAPEVIETHVNDDGIEIVFDKYINPGTANAGNIVVSTEAGPVSCDHIEFLDRTPVREGSQINYAKRVRFVPGAEKWSGYNAVTLAISGVNSYADIPMAQQYIQTLDVEPEIMALDGETLINLPFDEEKHQLIISALPGVAAKNQPVTVSLSDEAFFTLYADEAGTPLAEELTFNEDGQLIIYLGCDLIGSAIIKYQTENGRMWQTQVNIIEPERLDVQMPTASRSTMDAVYRGSKVALIPNRESEVIYFTTDGQDPAVDEEMRYNHTLTIEDDVVIKAISTKEDTYLSDVATFAYNLKRTQLQTPLAEGWTWYSHNAEQLSINNMPSSVVRISSLYDDGYFDEEYGFWISGFDNLNPIESYKIKSTSPCTLSLSEVEVNPDNTFIWLNEGWNWIGYPVYQTESLAEAFANLYANRDDMVIGQSGMATYDGSQWVGTLQTLDPGQGYLYYSHSYNYFCYNTDLVSYARARYANQQEVATPWSLDIHKYPDVMNLIADVFDSTSESVVAPGTYTVAAFSGSECRGIGRYVEGHLFITVHGNQGDEISFRAYDAEHDQYYNLAEMLSFSETVLGTLTDSFQLTMGDVLDIRNIQLPQHADQITLVDLAGNVVKHLHDANPVQAIQQSQVPAGTYILRVQEGEQYYYQKCVITNK